MFEAASYNNFWDILITTSFQCPNLQRAVTQKSKKKMLNFDQVIYSLFSISWQNFKLLAVKVFEIYWLQVSMPKFAKDKNSKKIKIFFFHFHQVIYSSSSVNWPSLKLLANLQDILTTSFQCPNLQRAITKKTFFFKFSPGNLLIIFCQLTLLEAASYYNNLRDILITSFQCPNLQKAITSKQLNNFFF